MTSPSDQFNRIASDEYDAEQIQEKIKAQKQAQAAAQTPENASGKPYLAPRTPTETWLAETMAEWLELERVSIDDDFFEMGGDSIKALRILSAIRDNFEVELPQSILFSVQFTVIEMAELIDQRQLDAINPDELNALINEIDDLSDEDVKAQLDGEE